MPVWNLEWLNMNASRAFPFKEDTTRADENGLARIPDSMLVDFVMVMPVAADFPATYVSQVLFAGDTVTLVISESGGGMITSVTASVSAAPNTGYNVIGQGDYADSRGRAVFGDLSRLSDALPQGSYTFLAAATEFEARCVRPDLRAVRMIKLVKSDGSVIGPLTGIIELVEGTNVRLTYLPDDNAIRIDAIEGEGLNKECACDKTYVPPAPIRTINGITPDTGYGIEIVGDECLEVLTEGNKITLRDRCTKPCCGCTELEFITANLKQLDAGVSALETRSELLEANQANFFNSVLGSIL